MMRYEYLYDQTLREFHLLTMDPRPNAATLQQAVPAVGEEVEIPMMNQLQTEGKRESTEKNQDDLPPAKRLKSAPMEMLEDDLPPVASTTVAQPVRPKDGFSPISDSESVTNLEKMVEDVPSHAYRNLVKESEEGWSSKSGIYHLAGGSQVEELKIMMIISRMITERWYYYKMGLLLGVGLPRLDTYLAQHRDNLLNASMEMLSDLVEREKKLIRSPNDLLELLYFCAEECQMSHRFEIGYYIEYTSIPDMVDGAKMQKMLCKFGTMYESHLELLLLLVAENCYPQFITPMGVPTALARVFGIQHYQHTSCAYGTRDGRLLFFRTLASMVDEYGIACVLWKLQKAEKDTDSGETDLVHLASRYDMLDKVIDEVVDDIEQEDEQPLDRPLVCSMLKKKMTRGGKEMSDCQFLRSLIEYKGPW